MSKTNELLAELTQWSSYGHDFSIKWTTDEKMWVVSMHFIPHSNYFDEAPTLEEALQKLIDILPDWDAIEALSNKDASESAESPAAQGGGDKDTDTKSHLEYMFDHDPMVQKHVANAQTQPKPEPPNPQEDGKPYDPGSSPKQAQELARQLKPQEVCQTCGGSGLWDRNSSDTEKCHTCHGTGVTKK